MKKEEEAKIIRNRFLKKELTSEEALWDLMTLLKVSDKICEGWTKECSWYRHDLCYCFSCDDFYHIDRAESLFLASELEKWKSNIIRRKKLKTILKDEDMDS